MQRQHFDDTESNIKRAIRASEERIQSSIAIQEMARRRDDFTPTAPITTHYRPNYEEQTNTSGWYPIAIIALLLIILVQLINARNQKIRRQ